MAGYVSPVSGAFAPNASNIFGASRSGGGRLHAGDDWHAPAGSPLVASIGGRVVYIGNDTNAGGYGHFVDVLGSDGNVIRYAPHAAVTAKVGQQVAAGEQIGVIGSAPGGGHPHLHMEVIPPGTPAYRAAVKGGFGSTARVRGYVSTVDPAKFFGLEPGTLVAAGHPLGDMQRAATEQGIATRQEDIASADFPMPAGQATRGGFENALVQAESNGKNVPNVTDPGPNVGGGYFQIKDPTWTAYAKQAGVDTTLYPNALASPYEIQRQVASVIPLGQWGPRTLRMVQAAGYTIDKGKTFAQNVLANGEVLGGAPPVAAAGQAGYPTTTASLLFGGGGSNVLAGGDRAPVMPTAQVGGGQPLSPDVHAMFFPTPAPTLQPHLTAPGGYAPTITAIQPYSTQPSPEVLAAAYGQRDASYAQPQYDIGPTVQREPVGPSYVSPPVAPAYTPPPAAALPVAPSDFTQSDLMRAQLGGVGQDIFGGGQAPAAAPMPGGTPAPVQVGGGHPLRDLAQHFVQNILPNVPSIFQHLTGGAQGPGVTGPLPAGVSGNNAVGALLGGQNWHAPSLFNSSGGINPSGGSSYNYFSPSSPGGIGGYMTSTGHIYTYPTDPDIYHSVAS